MPIRINLLAELQAAEETRRKDPVKRAIWVGGSLIFLVLLYCGFLYFQLIQARAARAEQESRWTKNKAGFDSVTEDQRIMTETEGNLMALTRFSTNRFLWAPVMNALQQAFVPPLSEQLQLELFQGVQNYDMTAATPPSRDKKTPGKPAASTERVQIKLRARDYGNQNDANYNRLKAAIANQAYFKQMLPKNEGVKTSSIVGPINSTGGDAAAKSYYQFTLDCRFQEVKREQ